MLGFAGRNHRKPALIRLYHAPLSCSISSLCRSGGARCTDLIPQYRSMPIRKGISAYRGISLFLAELSNFALLFRGERHLRGRRCVDEGAKVIQHKDADA